MNACVFHSLRTHLRQLNHESITPGRREIKSMENLKATVIPERNRLYIAAENQVMRLFVPQVFESEAPPSSEDKS